MTTIPVSDLVVDASNTLCPTPVLKARDGMKTLQKGQVLKLLATDPGSKKDIPAFARMGGHELLFADLNGPQFVYVLRKGGK